MPDNVFVKIDIRRLIPLILLTAFLTVPLPAAVLVTPAATPTPNCVAAAGKLATSAEQQQAFAAIEHDLYWNKWIDDEADYRRLIGKTDYDANVKVMNPTQIYGERNFLAWRDAADYLSNIPIGQLELSLDLFSKVHEKDSEGLNPILKKLRYVIPDGFVPSKGGVYKRRVSIGKDPLFDPLTEHQYEAIRKNPWLHGFIELPGGLSRPDRRRGILVYALPSEVKPKLEKLIQWYNENKSTMDPIELAANFERAFVSIHPFIDGNGRTARLLMDRILAEHGLPAPVLNQHLDDIYDLPDEYVQEVRQGIQNFFDIAKQHDNYTGIHGKPIVNQLSSGAKTTGFGLRLLGDPRATNKPPKYMSIANWGTPEIKLGGQPFVFMSDGFFYSNKGIPYVYHEGTLYPIADQAYFLYFARTGDKIKLTKAQRDVYREHFRLLRTMDSKKLDPAQIKIAPYATIQTANNSNQLFLYDWQRPLFREAVKIGATDPVAVLSDSRIQQTDFEQRSPIKDWKPEASLVLAQYETMDLKYWNRLQYAKAKDPEAVPEIIESRKKLWKAGRELLKDFLMERAALTDADRKTLEGFPPYRLWNDYFSHSKLSYEDFDKALATLGDGKIYLLRSDSSLARLVGFRSQADYRKLLQSLPESIQIQKFLKGLEAYCRDSKNQEAIQAKLKELQNDINAEEKIIAFLPESLRKMATDINGTYGKITRLLSLLNSRIFASKYDSRGTSAEYQRAFVDFALHARGGSGAKVGTSFTTSLKLLVPSQYNVTRNSLAFSNSTTDSNIFLVDAPKDKMAWNIASGYASEYEVIGMKPISAWNIQSRYSTAELFEPRPTDLSANAKEFLRKYQIGIQVTEPQTKRLKELVDLENQASTELSKAMSSPTATNEQKQAANAAYTAAMYKYSLEYQQILNGNDAN